MSAMGQWNQKEWEDVHAAGYQQHVYSITHEPFLCDKLTETVTKFFPNAARILVPGCGSTGLFEQRLSRRPFDDEILCTDFAGVIQHVPQTGIQKISYAAHNSTTLPFCKNFDVVIPVNAVVSGNDEENIIMLKNFHQALAPDGMMIGFFPTVFSPIDIQLNTPNKELRETMTSAADLHGFAEIDPSGESTRQIFYSPGALRKRLLNIGFRELGMEIVFFDTPYLQKEAERLYGITPEDVPIYELLVTAKKPAQTIQ